MSMQHVQALSYSTSKLMLMLMAFGLTQREGSLCTGNKVEYSRLTSCNRHTYWHVITFHIHEAYLPQLSIQEVCSPEYGGTSEGGRRRCDMFYTVVVAVSTYEVCQGVGLRCSNDPSKPEPRPAD
eukprot:2559856-Amphidinium_carterae.1